MRQIRADVSFSVKAAAASLLICTMSAVAELEVPQNEILAEAQWEQLDAAVNRALAWLASRQKQDGSFAAPLQGQPAITSLSVMAFLSSGHLPGQGPYGAQLNLAVDFMLGSQRKDGLIARIQHSRPPRSSQDDFQLSHYNHGITGVCLSEIYAMNETSTDQRVEKAVVDAVEFIRSTQIMKTSRSSRKGGWSYSKTVTIPDLSVTSWQLMFLRSAKNSGFDVPVSPMDDALEYVRRCYIPDSGAFNYVPYTDRPVLEASHALTGMGILSLAHAGKFDSGMAQKSGQWLLDHPVARFGTIHGGFHYTMFYTSAGMFQLGGRYWQQHYPLVFNLLISNQDSSGRWPAVGKHDGKFGDVVTTALAVIALNIPNQLLPIFQR